MTSSLEDWLNHALDDYIRAKNLSDKESLKDPESNPYKSKYEARTILEKIMQDAGQFADDDKGGDDQQPRRCYSPIKLIKILVNLELGVIDQDTEELSTSEKHLTEGRSYCNQWFKDDPGIILLKLNILNQLSYLWTMRANYEKALEYLKEAEADYETWNRIVKKDDFAGCCGIEFINCFQSNPLVSSQANPNDADDSSDKVERTFTQTLYFMAQVYEKLSDNLRSARYCHSTLKRQYHYNDYQAIDWSLNAATLAQYYAGISKFKIGGHLLACGRYVLFGYSSEKDDEEEKLNKSRADLCRICVKFYLMLLEASRKLTSTTSPEEREQESSQELEGYTLIPEEVIESETKIIKTSYVTSFQDAKEIFLQAQTWLNDAKTYYTLNEHASDYVECIQDNSKLYRLLIHFDNDVDRKCKMHKRRLDLLEKILQDINVKYFLSQSRQINFELGEIYTELMELKADKRPDAGSIRKINSLITKGIEHYQKFVDSFKTQEKNFPSRFDDEMVKPILVSLFSIGRLYTKIIRLDTREQVENWRKCEDYYSQVKTYIETNPDQRELIREEIGLIEEMLALIPKRISILLNAPLLS